MLQNVQWLTFAFDEKIANLVLPGTGVPGIPDISVVKSPSSPLRPIMKPNSLLSSDNVHLISRIVMLFELVLRVLFLRQQLPWVGADPDTVGWRKLTNNMWLLLRLLICYAFSPGLMRSLVQCHTRLLLPPWQPD